MDRDPFSQDHFARNGYQSPGCEADHGAPRMSVGSPLSVHRHPFFPADIHCYSPRRILPHHYVPLPPPNGDAYHIARYAFRLPKIPVLFRRLRAEEDEDDRTFDTSRGGFRNPITTNQECALCFYPVHHNKGPICFAPRNISVTLAAPAGICDFVCCFQYKTECRAFLFLADLDGKFLWNLDCIALPRGRTRLEISPQL